MQVSYWASTTQSFDDIRTAGYAGELVVAEDLSQVTLG